MAGANAGLPRNQVHHGARAYLTIDGSMVGYCQNVTATETWEWTPVDVLDNIEVEEHVPTAYNCNWSAVLVHVVSRSMKQLGLSPSVQTVLTHPALVIEVKDRPEDQAEWTIEGARVGSDTWNVAKRQLTVNNISGPAIRVRDHRGVA
jgi:hypothetical protein